MQRVRRAAALGAVLGVGASLALAEPVLAQTSPSPDPDPQVRPDPIRTSTVKTTSSPVTRAPTSQTTSSAGSGTLPSQKAPSRHVAAAAPQPTGTTAAPKSRSSHRTRRAAHRDRARRARGSQHPAATSNALDRLAPLTAARPLFSDDGSRQADDRSRARALSLAAIALLLVVVAGGSLLRMSARVPQRGGWA
jgi:hypothetical protein